MPWVMDMTNDRGSPFVAAKMQFLKRVVVEDREALEMVPGAQFKDSPLLDTLDGNDDYEKVMFLRAQHEVGRAHYCLRQNRKTLPARMGHVTIWVCDRFKTILEELEPGLRQYVPVEIRMRDGVTPWPEPYWYMRNNHLIDSIVPAIGDGDPQRSKRIYWNPKVNSLGRELYDGRIGISLNRPLSIDGIVLSEEAIAGAHLWQERGNSIPRSSRFIFLSDEFVKRLRKAKATMGLELDEVSVSPLSAMSGRDLEKR